MQHQAISAIAVSEVRQNIASLVDRVRTERTRIIVQRSGIPVAAIISIDDLERLNRMDVERSKRFEFLQEMRAPFADVSADEIDREVALALEEVRAEMRAEGESDGDNGR